MRLCQLAIGAFEPPDAVSALVGIQTENGARPAVTIRYRMRDGGEHRLHCRFAGDTLNTGRLRLVAVARDGGAPLGEVSLHMLRLWLDMFAVQSTNEVRRLQLPPQGPRVGTATAVLVQQLINAVVPAAIYVLLALGFNLVYGLGRQINLAYGELLTLGAYAGLSAAAVALALAPTLLALLLAAFVSATVWGVIHGWAVNRCVFVPLRGAAGQTAMIASVGLFIAIQEALRLLFGGRDFWLPPLLDARIPLVGSAGFQTAISHGQLVVGALVLLAVTAVLLSLGRSRLGRGYRACAEDRGMATLVGIDTARTTAVAFALAGLLAGLAGAIVLLYYGGAGFSIGTLYGLKGLTAAILGGLGSPVGAVFGGVLLGLLEALWSGYLSIAYRDVMVFGLLAGALILLPRGLLGQGRNLRDPMIGAIRR